MLKIGVIGTADIARRKMIPAIKKMDGIEYAGVAIARREEWEQEYTEEEYEELYQKKLLKGASFIEEFGGRLYEGYMDLIQDESVSAVYIPLPPALHFKWAEIALKNHKHVLLEKPLTLSLEDTKKLVSLAGEEKLVLWENYAFCYHKQFQEIKRLVKEDTIGEVRLISAYFGFPFRGTGDFRYVKAMGGGALFDCGGYTIKAATAFMGDKVEVKAAQLTGKPGFDVDIYGNITLEDEENRTAHLSFGMDNHYICKLDLWGQKGEIVANRIFTAPENFEASVALYGEKTEELRFADDQFYNSLFNFLSCINERKQENSFKDVLKQAELVETVGEMGNAFRNDKAYR